MAALLARARQLLEAHDFGSTAEAPETGRPPAAPAGSIARPLSIFVPSAHDFCAPSDVPETVLPEAWAHDIRAPAEVPDTCRPAPVLAPASLAMPPAHDFNAPDEVPDSCRPAPVPVAPAPVAPPSIIVPPVVPPAHDIDAPAELPDTCRPAAGDVPAAIEAEGVISELQQENLELCQQNGACCAVQYVYVVLLLRLSCRLALR